MTDQTRAELDRLLTDFGKLCIKNWTTTDFRFTAELNEARAAIHAYADRLRCESAAPSEELTGDARKAVALAYGHLWHTNSEPMAPIPMRSPEQAAYEARKLLRGLLTNAERGEAINEIGKAIGWHTCEESSECKVCDAAPSEPAPSTDALTALARRCLWIAYCWNDVNFDDAHTYARKTAQDHGITSFDAANEWLAASPTPAQLAGKDGA